MGSVRNCLSDDRSETESEVGEIDSGRGNGARGRTRK